MIKNRGSTTNFIRQIIETDLSNSVCKNIRTRFPPEPNGYLHLGHAKSICLNFGIAKDYKGECNLRFDDTNPTKESIEFVESIKHDIEWLGFKWSGDIHHSSDYFNQLYHYAIELINKDLAYVDELSLEEIREHRGTLIKPGINSPYRNRNVKENLIMFQKMRNGNFKEGQACLRAKIDMSSNFMIMRDPVLYRIKYIQHHQTGNQWCIYPMYDFTHCISDAIEGITHSLCTLEFQDNRRLYEWILKNITISSYPKQYEFSRLNIEYGVISKRHLVRLVNEKIVEGWDDPRMLTISGLRRRGYTASSIREFCNRIGVTKQDNTIEMISLESCIREELNENAPRVMAVLNPLKIIIENLPLGYQEIISMPNHPKKPEMGERSVPFSREIWIDHSDFLEQPNQYFKRLILGNEVRLRNAYIIRAQKVIKNVDGKIICVSCTCDMDTLGKRSKDGRKVPGVIHWVSAIHAISAEFRLYNNLFNVKKPLDNKIKDFLSNINPKSLEIKQGFVELTLYDAMVMSSYQFEREGYFCIDSIDLKLSKIIFNRIVSLRNTF